MKQNTLPFQIEMLTIELNAQVENYFNLIPSVDRETSKNKIIAKIKLLQKELNLRIALIFTDNSSHLKMV